MIALIADEALYGRYKRARNHQQVMVEDTDQVEERIEAGHNLARLDAGDVHLGQTAAPTQFSLAPAMLRPRLLQLLTKVFR